MTGSAPPTDPAGRPSEVAPPEPGHASAPDELDAIEQVFGGPGAARVVHRTVDWAGTSLGPVSGWSGSLRATARMVLASRVPMIAFCGPEYVQVYNDAFVPSLGDKAAAGLPGAETWAEVWDEIGVMFDQIVESGEADNAEDLHFELRRSGFAEETYFTYFFSPLHEPDGSRSGILCATTETTPRVLAQRRLDTLRRLAASGSGADTAEEAIARVAEALADNGHDLPFTLLYRIDVDGSARLAAATGLPGDAPGHDEAVTRDGPGGWPVHRAVSLGRPTLVEDLGSRFPGLRAGPWPEAPHSALLLPLTPAGGGPGTAVLVAGLSPRLALDERYREFLELVGARVAAALTDAHTRQAERELLEKLAELDRTKTEFFSNVSHEFRTPLALIMGPVEQLRTRRLEPEVRAELDTVHHNGLRLRKLVDTLLDFSRLQAGRVEARFEPVDLAGVTRELASVFRSAMQRAGLDYQVDCPGLPEPVFVDRSMWERIVLNLLSNALKYTLAGSVRVSLQHRPGTVALRIIDTGVGVPATEVEHLFERFHRVASAEARSTEGSGIGLALVHELVALHGGTVAVASRVGAGSTFTVTLPTGHAHLPVDQVFPASPGVDPGPEAAGYVAEALRWLPGVDEEAPAEPDAEVADRGRVLVVDDNADMRAYLRRLLSERHQVHAVAGGRAALDAALAATPDLIVTDIMLPDLDGIELVRRLRADPATAPVPIVMLSARAGAEAAAEGLAAGADDYLVKPFAATELLARVESHLRLGRARREAELRFRALADATPAMIWVDGPDGRRVFVNRAWSQFAGAPASGATWRDRIHPEDRARYDRVRTAAEDEGLSFEVEYRLRTTDGRYRWVFDRGAPTGPADAPRGYVGGCLDVDAPHRDRDRQRVLTVTLAELNRMTTLVQRRAALARVLVDEGLVDVARVIDFDTGLPPAIAARSEREERVIAQLRYSDPYTRDGVRGREPQLMHVDDDYIARSSSDEHQRELRRQMNMGTVAHIPLMARGRVVGLLSVNRTKEAAEQLDEADLALLTEVGERASFALDNANLLEREQLTSRRLQRLQEATAALSAAATPAQVARATVDQFGRLLDTLSVAVFELRETGSLDALEMAGWPAEVGRDWPSIPLAASAPVADAARRREPVWMQTAADWASGYPHLAAIIEGYGYRTLAALPLLAGGECLGAVVLAFPTERILADDERSTVLALADQCAQALQRAGLLAAESEARRAAEDLGTLVGSLSRATTPEEVGEVVLAYTAQLGATETVVVLRDRDRLTTLAASSAAMPLDLELDAAHPLAYTARSGQPVWLASRSPLVWQDGGFATDQTAAPVQMSLPLVVGWSVVGAIGLHFGAEVPALSAAARSTILAVAGQCAQALDRARLHQAEHEVAEVLQRSLLPRRLPQLDRLSVAASYLPGATGTQAGGDWYDLLPIGGSRMAIAVGDVVGHGAGAAAVMGQLRSALAGYLLEGHPPAAALERLDRFAGQVDGALGSTCACLTLDWDTGELHYARAGHPPIVLLESEGPRLLDQECGTVLGVRHRRAPYREAATRVSVGVTVLLYTDGLVERPHEPLNDGLRRLCRTADKLAHLAPVQLVPELVRRMLLAPEPSDDVAVVAVRLEPASADLAPTPASTRGPAPSPTRSPAPSPARGSTPAPRQSPAPEPTRSPAPGPAPGSAPGPAPGSAPGPAPRGFRRLDPTSRPGAAPAPPRTCRLDGDLTMDTVDEARATVLNLLAMPGDLVIDLCEVGYLGSAAVALLAEVTALARERGVQLSVRVSPGSLADQAIALTGLGDALDIELDSLR
ncbi:MAG: SpoIIE family protein phosphatase [Pseudonocardia sp.]